MEDNKNYDVEEELLDSDAFEDYDNENSNKKQAKNDASMHLTLNLKLDKNSELKSE